MGPFPCPKQATVASVEAQGKRKGYEAQIRPRAETLPGTQAVKGLIPEREGQAYRPDRVNRIKGRAHSPDY